MNNIDWKLEQERHALKAARYRNFIQYSEWQEYVKDLKEQIEVHKNLAVAATQQNKPEDAKKQAFIVMGIEEALSRPKDVIDYHENTFKKLYRQICGSCGNFVKWANKSEVVA